MNSENDQKVINQEQDKNTELSFFNPKRHSERTKALLALGLVSFFWGTTWLASKRGVKYVPALQLSGMRHLIGGSLYVLYFFIKGYKFPTKQQFFQIFWMSIVMFVLSNGLSTWSVAYLPSGLSAVIGSITPVWIALFSVFLFRESKLNTITIIGLIVGFAGILVIFSDYINTIFNSGYLIGIILGTIATMTWALGTLYTVKHAKDLNAYFSLGWQMFLSGIMLNVISLVIGNFKPLNQIPLEAYLSVGYLVVIGSIITFGAFIYAIKRLPPAQSSIYAYINPIVAVIIGALLNNEELTIPIIVGTLVTLLGVYFVNMGIRRSKAVGN
jgi:drug/metabolite transporter (DMT)-like permease